MIHVADSTTVRLTADCTDRAKAADTHDSTEATALCAGVKDGEMFIFGKAYVDFRHLRNLCRCSVSRITRAKGNMRCETAGRHGAPGLNIVRDDIIRPTGRRTSMRRLRTLRLIEAAVGIDGKLL